MLAHFSDVRDSSSNITLSTTSVSTMTWWPPILTGNWVFFVTLNVLLSPKQYKLELERNLRETGYYFSFFKGQWWLVLLFVLISGPTCFLCKKAIFFVRASIFLRCLVVEIKKKTVFFYFWWQLLFILNIDANCRKRFLSATVFIGNIFFIIFSVNFFF